MTNEAITIDSVAAQFASWRKNKVNGAEKIPVELWEQIKILLKSTSYSKIAKKLGLSSKQFRNNKLLDVNNKAISNSFISFPIVKDTIKKTEQITEPNLTIIRGEVKCLIANPTAEQFQLIITSILGG
jgi:hypothetical protein